MQAQDFTTPMMRQYRKIKEQYHDCLLFFRMGDFYELFLEDAKVGAAALDIVLTSRAKGRDGRIPMAGVPYRAVDSYIARLVRAGHKVAICEQISEPDGRGIVERQVIRVVTPGTITDEQSLNKKENNYIVSLYEGKQAIGIAYADVSTGAFFIGEYSLSRADTLDDEIVRLHPTECILFETQYNTPAVLSRLSKYPDLNIYPFGSEQKVKRSAGNLLESQFGPSYRLMDFSHTKTGVIAAALLINYLRYTQKNTLPHMRTISFIFENPAMQLDRATITNLELFSTIRNQTKQGSIIEYLDKTKTAMGGRKLRNWLRHPLIELKEIERRHEAVEELLTNTDTRCAVCELLQQVGDIERILTRISLGSGNARDLVALKESLRHILQIKSILHDGKTARIQTIREQIDPAIDTIVTNIEKNIVNEPPIDIKGGGLIRRGVDTSLDALRDHIHTSKQWIETLEKQEQKRTGIASLKVRFNTVFGYYIEISRANLHRAPENYIRKQTLVNAERFITEELKEKEDKIVSGEEQIQTREYEIFCHVRTVVVEKLQLIQEAATAIAILDCLISFANLAEQEEYVCPTIDPDGGIHIVGGWHPVVQLSLRDRQFIPNDTHLDGKKHQLLIVTGPNMAGKSVYLRQVALIVLLAQIGSFVPARAARVGLVDRIFVRSGASDMITDGLSTFMVEMVETASILHKATSHSLVIMDEIGRGTSTYDGISIAWAVASYIVKGKQHPKTLFATHYHELQELERHYSSHITNHHMAVSDEEGVPLFLYTLEPGAASHSYGVSVARMAGLPAEVIDEATAILAVLERGEKWSTVRPKDKKTAVPLSSVEKELARIDINTLTPVDALNTLVRLKKLKR